ncbi:hypothetical protein [Caballeronia grimmiae]|uniref:hypothetical protein n=1 Tax=Caballeronia grimmiae TaxID=1071679 RepID=UPI0038BC8361
MKIDAKIREAMEQTYVNQLPPEIQAWSRESLMGLLQGASTMSNDWAMETVKHLAIVNGGGLAGAVAMFSAPTKFPNSEPAAAAQLFFLGLAASFITLCMAYCVSRYSTKTAAVAIMKYMNGLATASILLDLEPKWGIRCVWALSILSMGLFASGILFLTPFDGNFMHSVRGLL